MKKILLFSIIFLAIFSFFPADEVKAGSSDNVSGWAWSENIGWISFNNTTGGGTTNYGVNINPSTGIFSGYAWSEHIGWITFNVSELAGCPSGTCQAKIDWGTKQISGWARALSYGGGWDGWIRLRDTNYGVWLNSSNEFRDWAWSDMVIGWVSFNCQNQGVCGTSNYKVVFGSSDTTSPTVTVIADPTSVTTVWQNTDAQASVSCSDTGTGCDSGSYRLKTYTSSGSCSTVYSDYTLSSPQTISSHVWVCAAAKDLAGNAGFSVTRVEFKVDKNFDNVQIQSENPSGLWQKSPSFTIDTLDEDLLSDAVHDCGYKVLSYEPNDTEHSTGWLPRTCNNSALSITVGSGQNCGYESANSTDYSCYVYLQAYDLAGNRGETNKGYHIDWTKPQPGKLYITPTEGGQTYPIEVNEGAEYTYKAHITDNLKITSCDLYINGVNQGIMSPTVPGCDKDCTFTGTHTFPAGSAGTYHNNYTKCKDAAGNIYPVTQSEIDNIKVDIVVKAVNQPPICQISVPSGGIVNQWIEVNVSGSSDPEGALSTVNFSSDSILNGVPNGSWDTNGPYNWNVSSGNWNATNKTMKWSFANSGTYEVWAQVTDNINQTASCYDTITITSGEGEFSCTSAADCSSFYDGGCGYQGICNCGLLEKPVWSCVGGSCQCVCQYNAACETPPLPCQRQNPDVYLSPSFQSGPAGQQLLYTVSVINNDSSGCSASNFSLTKSCPSGWPVCSLDLNTLSISPGQSESTILRVRSSSLYPKGDYEVSVTATNNSATQYFRTGYAIYQITTNSPTALISCHPNGCSGAVGSCTGYTWSSFFPSFCLKNDSTDPDGISDIKNSIWTITGQMSDTSDCLAVSGIPICNWTLPSNFTAGNYTAELYVEDQAGASDTDIKNFTILQDAIAEFDCSLNSAGPWQECNTLRASEGEKVYFRDKSTPSDGGAPIKSWSWTFEDGTPGVSTQQNPSTKFRKLDPGSGMVTLTIIDNVGRSDTVTYQVWITVPLPEWQETPPF